MRLGLAAKEDEPHRVKIARYVFDYLKGRTDVFVQPELAKVLDAEAPAERLEDMKVDVMITVGGDGTILHAMQRNPAPVFGINVGEIGFLAEAEPIELPDALDGLLSSDYFVESRLKLEARVNDERLPLAVNEVAVKTTRSSKMIGFHLAVGSTPVQDLRADGIIVATPTGSTSYAMSAGGPIMDPGVDAFVLAALAPFSLTSRPFVFPRQAKLQARLDALSRDAVVVVDGQHERLIKPGDVLTFTGATERAQFVRFRPSFYDRLRERLSQG